MGNLCMKYLHHMKVIPEDEIPVGSHYRARTDMMDNVRGYRMVKDGLRRRIRYRRQVFLQAIYRVATSTGRRWTPSFIMKSHVLSATHIHDAQSSKTEPKLE